jgi:putative pyruvate formate lyase activating enzyme
MSKLSLIKEKSRLLNQELKSCRLCPRDCKINRFTHTGYCKAGPTAVVYTVFKHFGEEPAISAQKGSGTIFFSGCSLGCIYCQNYKFSNSLLGTLTDAETLASIMLKLQKQKATNINLVTPTHFLPQILAALSIAIEKGLRLPLVYNTSGYEKKEIIGHLEGIVDIYLSDLKYLDPLKAQTYSKAGNYPQKATEAIKEMDRQVKTEWDGEILKKGLVIRHLVLPQAEKDSLDILKWIKKNAPESLLSLMFQFQPYFKSALYPEINRKIDLGEYLYLKKIAEKLNLKGWIQSQEACEELAGAHFQSSVEEFLKEREK